MYAKGRDAADKREQSDGPAAAETDEQREARKHMDQ